jgi:hypothetical protein
MNMTDCDRCKFGIVNNEEIYGVVFDMEQSGLLPVNSYNNIVEQVCTEAKCPCVI